MVCARCGKEMVQVRTPVGIYMVCPRCGLEALP